MPPTGHILGQFHIAGVENTLGPVAQPDLCLTLQGDDVLAAGRVMKTVGHSRRLTAELAEDMTDRGTYQNRFPLEGEGWDEGDRLAEILVDNASQAWRLPQFNLSARAGSTLSWLL